MDVSTAPLSQSATRLGRWPGRLRLWTIVAAVSALLVYLSGFSALTAGSLRPLVLLGAGLEIPVVIAGLLGLLLGAWALGALEGRSDGSRGLLVIGFGLAIWALNRGNVDHWLMLRNPAPGPATATPYFMLVPDYVVLALVTAGAAVLSAAGARIADPAVRRSAVRSVFGLDLDPAQRRQALTALIMTVAIGGALMLLLTGPRAAETRRGQVYFAVAASFWLASFAARNVTGVRAAIAYWPAPILAGVLGLLLAAWRPGLPVPYDQINNIPAFGLVRALPVEMVGVGLLAVLWSPLAPPADAKPAPRT